MSKFEIYSIILCIIVFVMLVSVFSYLLTIIVKQSLKHVKAGLEDENLIKEFSSVKKPNKFSKFFNIVLNFILCVFFVLIFSLSLYINCTQNVYFDNFPTYRVVLTSSMENKNKENTYLMENNLNNQISAFDLIITYKIPDEDQIKLYDIVVYEVDGILVVHRVVGIEQENESHPNEKYFLLQGDAVGKPDRFPVRYSQMKGIYRNERIPFVGSFVLFMQSPAGWLCLLLILAAMILTPIFDKKLLDARKNRYLLINQQAGTVLVEDTALSSDEPLSVLKVPNTFKEMLAQSSENLQSRYSIVVQALSKIENIRLIDGKMQQTYKSNSKSIAKIFFKGKMINVALALQPSDYDNTKYKFVDISNIRNYRKYPMCLKLTSERQALRVCELILDIAKNNSLKLLNKPVDFNN